MERNEAEQQIINAEKHLLEAQRTSDVNALDLLLHDDLLFARPDGTVFTKAMDLEAHRSKTMVVDEMTSTPVQISIIEDNAVVAVRSEAKGSIAGVPMNGTFRYIRVWRLFGNQWKVIGGSLMRLQ